MSIASSTGLFRALEDKESEQVVLQRIDRNSNIWFCPDSHLYVNYSTKDKFTLMNTLEMEEFVIDRRSVSFGHGYVQHAGCDGNRYTHFCITHLWYLKEQN